MQLGEVFLSLLHKKSITHQAGGRGGGRPEGPHSLGASVFSCHKPDLSSQMCVIETRLCSGAADRRRALGRSREGGRERPGQRNTKTVRGGRWGDSEEGAVGGLLWRAFRAAALPPRSRAGAPAEGRPASPPGCPRLPRDLSSPQRVPSRNT